MSKHQTHIIEDVRKIPDIETLVERSKWLEGKTLAEITEDIAESDDKSRVLSKAGVGDVIEQGFFGIPRNSDAMCDIPHLGVEIKTSPLKYNKDRTKLTVKEPLSLNIINYFDEAKTQDIKESLLYKKNKKILFFFYIHDSTKKRSEYEVKYVFLWDMDDYLEEMRPDYEKMVNLIREGKAHPDYFGQSANKYAVLSNCPKHGGTFSDSSENTSKARQPFSDVLAERRAFRFPTYFMVRIIARELGFILTSGNNQGGRELYWDKDETAR